jgi:hypothetical protein
METITMYLSPSACNYSESEDNYSNFLSAVMEVLGSTRDGVVGKQLNHTDTVIAVLRVSVPDALHRFDLCHIMKNVNDNKWESESSYTTTEKEFKVHMATWKLAHPEAAAYVDEIDHDRWANYRALLIPTFT